ncbi:hypothetical protein [Wolbachia endosymbiont (group A) of Anomoia purmunda]|nr:hypothetical protein [Wolbachia endosymbiont (group A) of Anomoia purmunda]
MTKKGALESRKKNDVMQVADTDFHPQGCHPSSPFGVIPVPLSPVIPVP